MRVHFSAEMFEGLERGNCASRGDWPLGRLRESPRGKLGETHSEFQIWVVENPPRSTLEACMRLHLREDVYLYMFRGRSRFAVEVEDPSSLTINTQTSEIVVIQLWASLTGEVLSQIRYTLPLVDPVIN